MKNHLLLSSALLVTHPFLQASNLTENCTAVYDPITDSYNTECLSVPVEHYFSDSFTLSIMGTTNYYVDGILKNIRDSPFGSIEGRVTETSWYNDLTMERGIDTTVTISQNAPGEQPYKWYKWSQKTLSQNGSAYVVTDTFEKMRINDDAFMTIDSPTLWDITDFEGFYDLRTLDGDNNGIPGIEITNAAWPENSVLEMQLWVIPLPATVWLFSSGLLGLLGFMYRRK